jgi:hypothetical protein
MTLLTDLGYFSNGLGTDGQEGTYGQAGQVYPLSGNIFGKIPGPDIQAPPAHFLYAFHRQEAHLAMPGAGMGIPFQAVAGHQHS